MAVAEAMPEHLYHTRPAETVWPFGELMHHIAYGIQWWEENDVKGNSVAWDPVPVKKSKREVMDYLSQAYASLSNTIREEKLSDDAVRGFHATIDHITHHRGQAILHLRCQGIEPPEYIY